MKVLLFLIAIFFAVTPAFAGPFGTEMGDPPSKFEGTLNANNVIKDAKLPKQHSAFNYYELTFVNGGLATILAASPDFTNDRYGSGVRSTYDTLKEQLTSKYGKPVTIEQLKSGSIWNKDSEFVASIYKHERYHGSIWNKDLGDNLIEIKLLVTATSSSNATLAILYRYKNATEIDKNKEKSEKDAL
ncbi:hypothetical protein [uncultured Desulfovibrio sp.]|uniref:hypothetical protein n=1 Tax=uncultured Desulfovibrio sp. TaxID=167968 RepID=UPI00266B6677|nr:hypothetical protein [uncultured Desulfovibrio sp.]